MGTDWDEWCFVAPNYGLGLHETRRFGNELLRRFFDRLHAGDSGRRSIPPIFVFSGTGEWRDVRFLGLAVPGGPDIENFDDLVAVWRSSEGLRFQNYRARFTILDVAEKAVLPSELERCAVTDTRVLRRLLVASSVSGARIQHQLAVRSLAGKYCAPAEARACMWSGRKSHPDDLKVCSLTGISFHIEFAAPEGNSYLQPLGELLHGVRHTTDAADRWPEIALKASDALRGSRCRVESAFTSPDRRHLALCTEVRTLLGLRVQRAGLLYSIEDGSIVGRVALGKRTPKGWIQAAP